MADTAGNHEDLTCLICGKPLKDTAPIRLCDEHLPRSARGALMPVAKDLEFRHRQGDWLLYWSTMGRGSGTSGRGYRADWLALNLSAGEVRWYLDTEEIDVWHDLLGIIAITSSTKRPRGWGKPRYLMPTKRARLRAVGWQLLGRPLVIVIVLLSGPLAICWHLLTGRVLRIQFWTFTYEIWKHFPPEHKNMILFGGKRHVVLRLLAQCPQDRAPSPFDSNLSIPLGPVEVKVRHCRPLSELSEVEKKIVLSRRASGLPRMSEIVQGARLPVYGPVGSPLGLQSRGLGQYDSSPGGISYLSLDFADQPATYENPARTQEHLHEIQRQHFERRSALLSEPGTDQSAEIEVRTIRCQLRGVPNPQPTPRKLPPVPARALQLSYHHRILYDTAPDIHPSEARDRFLEHVFSLHEFAPMLYAALPAQVREHISDLQCRAFCQEAHNMLWTYAPDLAHEVAGSGAQAKTLQPTIAGKPFQGQALYWPGPHPLCTFTLEHTEATPVTYRLDGASYGIAWEELLALLRQLVAVNDRPDLLAQYQREHDEHMERMRPF